MQFKCVGCRWRAAQVFIEWGSQDSQPPLVRTPECCLAAPPFLAAPAPLAAMPRSTVPLAGAGAEWVHAGQQHDDDSRCGSDKGRIRGTDAAVLRSATRITFIVNQTMRIVHACSSRAGLKTQHIELDVKRSTSSPESIRNTPSVPETKTIDAGRHPLAGAAANAPGAELANSSHAHKCPVGSTPHPQAPDQVVTKQEEIAMTDDDDWMNDVVTIAVPTSPQV